MTSRRRAATAAMAAVLLLLPPLGNQPAAAARKVRVVDCRASNSQCWPAAFAFTPGNHRIFYAERLTGQIRLFTFQGKQDHQWYRIPGVAQGVGQGLLGLALDPRWDQGWRFHFVYAYYTRRHPFRNQIVRIRRAGPDVFTRLITIGATNGHNGGAIEFGPDGKLYAVTGDAGQPARSQTLSSRNGKVLRMNHDGTRPPDNALPGLGHSYGHRNSFGFAFDPLTDRLWQTENGPECEDEINLIVPGGNFAWGPGGTSCPPGTNLSGPQPRHLPERTYTPVISPTGAAFCDGCGLGQSAENDLLFGAWNDGIIRRLVLDGSRNGIAAQHQVFNNPSGVLAVEAAPGGRIYFSDSSGIFRLRQN
jgi:glucose/arabinose dehydrogenase